MIENSDKSSDPGVKITDRRHFRSDGSPREPDAAGPSAGPVGKGQEPRREESLRGEEFVCQPAPEAGGETLPAVDFATLVVSFRTTALMHLGLIGDPAEAPGEVNLDGARQMIEILALLQQKTKGNLDPEEEDLLEKVLYELRLSYVNLSSSAAGR